MIAPKLSRFSEERVINCLNRKLQHPVIFNKFIDSRRYITNYVCDLPVWSKQNLDMYIAACPWNNILQSIFQ